MENKAIIEALQEQTLKTVVELLTTVKSEDVLDAVIPIVTKRIEETFGILPKRHEIVIGDSEPAIVEGLLHEEFDNILALTKKGIASYLVGEAGSGKNVICKQVAEALGLEFYFTNAVTQEYKLSGFIDANGKYHETQFYQAFTKGGLFFLDEMDASIPETLLTLNAALANGYFDFPIGRINAHPDFHVIAAGNTVGRGADTSYTGRYSLDLSSLDRFVVIHIGYSPAIELGLAKDNKELVEFAHFYREATKKANVESLFSYRTIDRIAKLEDTLDLWYIIQISLLKGMQDDDYNSIVANLRNHSSNKYVSTLINKKSPYPTKKSIAASF